MAIETEQPRFDFNTYPSVGEDDWNYVQAVAQIRAIEDNLFNKQFLTELANAKDFKELCDMLAGTDYAINPSMKEEEIEQLFFARRMEVRKFVEQLIDNEKISKIFKAKIDFSNLRLAIRRLVTEKPLGKDYLPQGNVEPDQFELAFEQEDYSALPQFLQDDVEAAVLAYYKNKNVRDIDIEIDKAEAEFVQEESQKIGHIFLIELFRMQTDLTNIRTMFRQKLRNIDEREAYLPGGYIEKSRLVQCIDIGFEALANHFFATPYYHLIESGAVYLQKNTSFLKLEAACDEHLFGYLKTTRYVPAGIQPVIAYLFFKEQEIRMVRLVTAGNKALIKSDTILDRIVV
ncbi:MAG: V-type ATPase subunit [Phycisphaerales bacterium]